MHDSNTPLAAPALAPRLRGWRRAPLLLLAMGALFCGGAAAGAPDPAGATGRNTSPDRSHSGEFMVRDGDVWVMVGDSITWQGLYTTYLEAFVRARYPRLKFAAVNSGKSGEVYIQGLVRFRGTIAAYRPTLVTVNYGMNDHTKVFPGEPGFLNDPKSAPQRFVEAVRGTGARLVMMSASPLLAPPDYATDGGRYQLPDGPGAPAKTPGGWRSNPVNKLFADRLAELAARNHTPFLDQMTPLQAVWAANYGRDQVAALRQSLRPLLGTPVTAANVQAQSLALANAIKPFLLDERTAAILPAPDKADLITNVREARGSSAVKWEQLRQYLSRWAELVDAADPPFVRLSGYTDSARATDLVHPNQAGHLHMAAVLLKLMNADGLVSEIAIDASAARVVAARKASARDISFSGGRLAFRRQDECLPFPVDPAARGALAVDVATALGSPRDLFGLSRYLLTVSNLPEGDYELAIDGALIATASAARFATGLDVGLTDQGPVAAQTQRVLEEVRARGIRAVPAKGQPAPAAVAEPYVSEQSQPVEHLWTVTRSSQDHARKGDHAQAE